MTRSIAIGRRLGAAVCRRPLLLIIAALVAVQVDVFVLGATLLPLTLPGMTPAGPYGYSGTRLEQPHSTSIDPAGAYDAEFTWAAYLKRSIWSGSVPFWNPYQGLGQPHLANYVSGVLYPVNWLPLVLPPAWWDLVFLIDWFIAAYSIYLVGRVFRLNRHAALIGAFAALAAGYFQGFLAVKSVIGTVAWFPFLIYSIERTATQPEWRWRHVSLAAGTYCLATAGHPSPAFIGLLLLVLFSVFRVGLARRSWRVLFVDILPAMFAGGLIAAPLLVPFGDYVIRGGIAVHSNNQGVQHLSWRGLPLTVFPFLYGPVNLGVLGNEHAALAWSPASVTFLALVGLFAAKTRRFGGLLALTLVAAVAAAKVFGVPIVNDVGRLPFLDQLWFTYANGFVTVALCVLAGAGVAHLLRAPARAWLLPLTVWALYVLAMLGVGVLTMVGERALLEREHWRALYFYAALAVGLGWAIAYPASLVLVRRRSPHSTGAFLLVASSGLLLQSIACFPSGSPRGYVLVNGAAALAFVLIVITAARLGDRIKPAAGLGSAVVAAAAVLGVSVGVRARLPGRYNPLTPAPYIDLLARLPNAPRLYPLDGVLFPNFTTPFGLSSMTNLDNLVTRQGAAFFTRFMDPGAHPARFYGMEAARDQASLDPMAEFRAHKRYWDFVGVRYLLSDGRDLNARVVAGSPVSGAFRNPVPLSSPLEVRVPCGSGPFDAVSVLLATYARRQSGTVTLDVAGVEGTAVATASVDASTLLDNADQRFRLSAAACRTGDREVLLRLTFTPAAAGDMIAAWQYPAWHGAGFFYRALETRSGDLFRMMERDSATGVTIWENPAAADRAFLAPAVENVPDAETAMSRLAATRDLRRTVFVEDGNACRGDATFPSDAEPGRLTALILSPNRVNILYEARTAGVLVLTDAYSQGWRATLDGREVPILRVDGAFRGVCVAEPGAHRVQFDYRPPFWRLALALFAAGAMSVLGLASRRSVARPSVSLTKTVSRRPSP